MAGLQGGVRDKKWELKIGLFITPAPLRDRGQRRMMLLIIDSVGSCLLNPSGQMKNWHWLRIWWWFLALCRGWKERAVCSEMMSTGRYWGTLLSLQSWRAQQRAGWCSLCSCTGFWQAGSCSKSSWLESQSHLVAVSPQGLVYAFVFRYGCWWGHSSHPSLPPGKCFRVSKAALKPGQSISLGRESVLSCYQWENPSLHPANAAFWEEFWWKSRELWEILTARDGWGALLHAGESPRKRGEFWSCQCMGMVRKAPCSVRRGLDAVMIKVSVILSKLEVEQLFL